MAHTCNPNTLGGRGGQNTRSGDPDPTGQQGETPLSTKNTKISWAWWHAPIISDTLLRKLRQQSRSNPGTQEAKTAVSQDSTTALQPGRQSESQSQKKKKKVKLVCITQSPYITT